MQEIHKDYVPDQTSVVKAQGDILAINDNLQEKEQAQAVYNPSTDEAKKDLPRIDPFDGW